MNNTNFDNLAGNLSESEKKILLNQISENLMSNPIQEDQKYSSFKEKENRDFKIKSLKKDVEDLGFIQKIILNIRGFVMGKDILEVHNHDLLQNIERRILYTSPTIVSLKKRRFTSILINDFLNIYSLSVPFIAHFSGVWESPIALERLIGSILSDKYNSIKTTLFDFIRESEIDNHIANGESLEGVKKHLLRAIYDYRKKIPDFIFPETEEELLSLISIKNIILYNYTPMFKLMGISGEDVYESVSNKSVSMNLVVKHIEEFYKLLIQFSGNALLQNTVESLIKLSSTSDEDDYEKLWNDYIKLSEKLKGLTVAYPFEDLIRYSKSNPFYKIDYSVSKINVFDFYFAALKKEMICELELVFKSREHSVVDLMFEKTFKNFDTIPLHNYAIQKDFDYKKLNLKYFKYTESLTILLNFLKHYYMKEYKDILFVLNKQIFEKNHVLQSRSLELSIGVETLIERILRLDRSLAPESEVGKTMKTLFTTVSTSKQNIRMYKAFIKQKDNDVLELLKLGSKLLQDLDKILNQTLKSPSDSVKLQISAIHPSISRKQTVKDVIADKSTELKSFLDIFNKKVIFDSEEK